MAPDFLATRAIDWSLHKKPTNQKTPLAQTSAHPIRVHESWPKGEIHRIYNRCSSHLIYEREKQAFCNRLVDHDFPIDYVNEIRAIYPGGQKMRIKNNSNCLYWVVPFHPCIEKSRLARIANDVLNEWYPGEVPIRVVISWKNSLTNISAQIRKQFLISEPPGD